MKRRALVLAGPLALAGCAAPRTGDESIVETAGGRPLSREALLQRLRASDAVLLGELHDNPLHHVRRGELIAALGPGTAVVAEQLTSGGQVGPQGDLLAALTAAGFDARAWGWPLHEPLFAAVRRARLPLAGGNLPREVVRRIARDGESALDAPLAALLRRAPLDAPAQATLDAELLAGHCGQLPADRLPRLRLAQRARDASFALALQASGGRPAVLVAGNGHVRRDHGVPALLAALQPGVRCVSVGFVDGEDDAAAAYDVVWRTPAPPREDPCAGLQMPR